MAGNIELLGGPDRFISRLDYYFESGLADISNEPSFLTVYAYHYAGRPALSSKRAHSFVPAYFNATIDGLPGNDDSGAMVRLAVKLISLTLTLSRLRSPFSP